MIPEFNISKLYSTIRALEKTQRRRFQMTRNFANSIMESERIRLRPNYVEVDLKPSFNDILFDAFNEKVENAPSWSPLLIWSNIAESAVYQLGRKPTAYDIMMATVDQPPKVGKDMTEWFKSLLPPSLVMTNVLTDREGWQMLSSLMKYKDDRKDRFIRHAGTGIQIIITMKRPVNENELLKKIYDQEGLGITSISSIEHVIVLLESNGIPYEYDIKESQHFGSVFFEIANLLTLF